MAHNEKFIDWKEFEYSLESGMNQIQIAALFAIDRDTLRDRAVEKYGMPYSAISAQFETKGLRNLHKSQYMRALDGSDKMLIWLGKIRLGQVENATITHVAPNQNDIDQTHQMIALQHEINLLKEQNEQLKRENPYEK